MTNVRPVSRPRADDGGDRRGGSVGGARHPGRGFDPGRGARRVEAPQGQGPPHLGGLPGHAPHAGRPDDVHGDERRCRRGERVRGARRQPHPRRGREPRPGPQWRLLPHAEGRDLHHVLPGRRPREGQAGGERRRGVGADARPRRRPSSSTAPTWSTRPRCSCPPRRRSSTAVHSGDVAAAKALYGPARIPYERIEPVAETFGDLDPEIDAREGDVPAKQWGGFHKIEKALWIDGTTEGMGDVADELVEHVERARRSRAQRGDRAREDRQRLGRAAQRGRRAQRSPARRSATHASTSSTSRPTSRARRPRTTPSARCSRAGTPRSRPPSTPGSPTSRRRSRRTARARRSCLYTALTKTDTKALAQSIDALAEPLSKVAKRIVTGS